MMSWRAGDSASRAAGIPIRGRAWRWAAAGVPLAVVTVVLGVWAARARPQAPGEPGSRAASRQPASWRMSNETLTVYDASGALLFEHSFGIPLVKAASSDTWNASDDGPSPVLIADLDGDGLAEVVVRFDSVDRAGRRLYCFEADGRLRFVRQPTGTRHFGDAEYGEPWLAHQAFVTRRPDGSNRLWAVFTHGLLFPTVLEELDPHGAVRQEYWSNGFIEFVAECSWNGRPVVLVGGTNNDFRAASLAVFPADGVGGAAPAARPAYACRDCAPGRPQALFLFPSLCSARLHGQATVLEAWVEHGDRLRVTVAQSTRPEVSATYYTLGPDGSLVGAEISHEFQRQHAALARQGLVDHPFGPTDEREMLPVRRWDGSRFVELPRVPVAH